MSGLENLFATDPALPQLSKKKLSEDPGKWAEELTTQLRELHPDTGPLPISVEFRKKDDQSGTAMGALHVVSMETGKSLHVPFIIRKFELSPLDVWMESQTQAVHPLTVDTFKEMFFSKAMAEGLDTRPTDSTGTYFNDPSLWTTNYPPLQGRYSYASAGYKVLDMISDSITKEDLAEFTKSIEKQATSLLKFDKHGHREILQKIVALKGKNKPMSNDFAASAMKLIPTSVASVKREGKDKYSILSYADRLFDLAASESMSEYSRDNCKAWLSKITAKPDDFLNEVDQEGEKMEVMPKNVAPGVFLFDDVRDKPEAANDFAIYHTKTEDGLGIEGVVIPHVIDFKGKKKGYKIFISKNHGAIQTQIAGVKMTNSDQMEKSLVPSPARCGQTGTFVFIDDGKAIATEPVTIKAVEEYGPLTAVTLDGKKIKISRGYSNSHVSEAPKSQDKKVHVLDVHGMIETRPDEFVIPQKMLWIPMESFREIVETPNEYLTKTAALQMTSNPVTVRYTGIVYEIEGNGLSKQAYDERHAKCLLACQGASVEKIAQIMKKAKTAGRVKVYGMQPLKKSADIIKEAQQVYSHVEKMAAAIKCDMIKIAAEFDDAATVDALLSLSFINPDNISKFVAYRPVFEKISDYLAELAVASRLGMKDIPESAVVIAMSKMRDVIDGLKRLEVGIKKTAATKVAEFAPLKSEGKEKGEKNEKGKHFSNGMKDAELGTHLFLNEAKTPQDALEYLNGKRLVEQNKTMANMAVGIQPKGAKPQQPAGAAGAKKK